MTTTAGRGEPFTRADLAAMPGGHRHELIDGVLVVTGPFTRADLDAWPDDGRRHELIDGLLVVTPKPGTLHQRAAGEVLFLLAKACPDGLEPFPGPLDVVLAEDSVLRPDLLVARQADLTERDVSAAPVLAVEVISPNTRLLDCTLKRARYEAAGTPSYWVVDPDEPSVTVWELDDGRYVEQAHVVGEDEVSVDLPFPVTLSPASLVSPG